MNNGPLDPRCGLCRELKHPVRYNASPTAVKMVTVLLCEACDRKPAPPQAR